MMAIERLMRNVVAAYVDFAAKTHFGSRIESENAAGDREGEHAVSGHFQ
jgi:hypothetical protein